VISTAFSLYVALQRLQSPGFTDGARYERCTTGAQQEDAVSRLSRVIISSTAMVLALHATEARAESPQKHAGPSKTAARTEVDKTIAEWPAKVRAVAYQVIREHGLPQEVTPSMLVWRDNGPWKRTVVYREEVAHNFPRPHSDMLEQVVEVRIPADKIDDIARLDGSITYNRTTGELSARCDKEAMNFLALNLAYQIAQGKVSVDDARKRLAKDAAAYLTEDSPPASTTGLAFTPERMADDTDKVTMPGAPQPATGGATVGAIGDAEIIGALIAVNAGEVELGRLALRVTKDDKVRQFAKMLEKDHGEGLKKALELGPAAKVTPSENGVAVGIEQSGAEALAKLAPLEGAAFDRAFAQIAIEAHQKVLDTVEKKLAPAARNKLVKDVLVATRTRVQHHLEEARKLAPDSRTSRR
jgi:predicted outer membrane protein